ncbi:MAG: DNA helicase RecQ [Acidobacteriota bacterium]
MPDSLQTRILAMVGRYWGFDRLLPLQKEAIQAALEQRDSLVVLPTGGGKSLCYQVPPLLAERLDIVVSPLISLMKDQVDALRACGYPATSIHSGMTLDQRRRAEAFVASGRCRLLLLSPERLLAPWFLDFTQRLPVGAFAIDEAHCISHWGHDFRPEYRQLSMLKERFPQAGIHAYTATATRRVRQDVIAQLRLNEPALLIGRFDRPNLIYRIVPRYDFRRQLRQVLDRHSNEAVIIYCISRAHTERLANHLRGLGFRAACYHAGMEREERRNTHEDFADERLDVIVATVAFGMGIDRSNVRCVVHAAMPKSIEHYQQETGRAGRDGLEAECILFYSPADALRWKSLVEKSAAESESSREAAEAAFKHLEEMRRYCSPAQCRHKALSQHFGQPYEKSDCSACDICLKECEELEDATTAAQMILSCVARVGQRFGIGHVVDVLRGANSEQILSSRHHQLSTFGLMRDIPRKALINNVYQLVDQGLLSRTNGEYPILKLNAASRDVLKGQHQVWLIPAKKTRVKRTAYERDSWEGVDRDLFEGLRGLRKQIAQERGVPPYVVFGDAALRDMSRRRPVTRGEFLSIHGVGEKKLVDFGPRFIQYIEAHTRACSTPASVASLVRAPLGDSAAKSLNHERQ